MPYLESEPPGIEGIERPQSIGAHPLKQYRFRLQSVLDYRSEQLNLVQQKVAEAEHERLKIMQRIQEYDALIEQAFADQQRALSEPTLDTTRLQGFPSYVWRLKQGRFQEHQTLQVQNQKLKAMREELNQALIKKKSLEKLKDKDYAQYRKKLDKAEEELLAELALNRATRRPASA